METTLLQPGGTPPSDAALMQALRQVTAPSDNRLAMTIGVEDANGKVYRIVRTNGLCEAVRIFESARQLGFAITHGRKAANCEFQKVLRWEGHALN
jgi:hypothetical protein